VTWWTILKNIKGPYTPVEFQTEEEIEDIVEDREKTRKIYSQKPANFDINLGNLRTLNELRASYFPVYRFQNITGIYSSVTQINFNLIIKGKIINMDNGNDIIMLQNINVHIMADSKKYIPIVIDYYSNDIPKVVTDWVELYNKPSNKYKNMRAFITVVNNRDYRLNSIHGIREKILKIITNNYTKLLKMNPLEYGDINFSNAGGHNIANKTLDTKIPNNSGGTYIIGFDGEESKVDVMNILKHIRGLKL